MSSRLHRMGARDKGNAVFLGDRADGERDAGLIGTGQRDHPLFRDQAQRLVLAGGGAALVVGKHDLDLGVAKAGKAGAFGEREIAEFGMVVVDDVHRHFDRGLGVHPGAGGVAAQRENSADLHGLLRDCSARQRKRHCGGRKQPEHMLEFHVIVSKGCARGSWAFSKSLPSKWRRRPFSSSW